MADLLCIGKVSRIDWRENTAKLIRRPKGENIFRAVLQESNQRHAGANALGLETADQAIDSAPLI